MNTPSYLTSITALNIPIPGRESALWHSHGLANSKAWLWAGIQVKSTNHLLGALGLYDATDNLRPFAPDIPEGTVAASYERALFDHLYHCLTVQNGVVTNVQPQDIDDAVDYALVMTLVDEANLSTRLTSQLIAWLQQGFIRRTIVKDWTLYRLLDNSGRRSRGAHLIGRIVASNDPLEFNLFTASDQLLEIDINREGRVGSHCRDYYLAGDGSQKWITLDQFRVLRQQLEKHMHS